MQINHVLGYDIYKMTINNEVIFSAKKDGKLICRSNTLESLVKQLMWILKLI